MFRGAVMADEIRQESKSEAGIKRRGLLRFGTILTAFTGASAVTGLAAGSAQAAPGDKNPPTSYVPVAEKGVASGVATLDGQSKVPLAQVPDLSATYSSQIKVTAYGIGVGTGDKVVDTAAAQRAIDAAATTGAAVVFPAGRTYNIGAITADSGAHLIIEAGAEIVCHSDTFGITSTGIAESRQRAVLAGSALGSSTLTLANVDGLALNDWLMVTSEDTIGVTTQKRGMLRRITSIDNSAVTLDGPLYMPLTFSVAIKITLAKPLTIEGGGRIRGATPANQRKALVRVLFGSEPSISGITVGPAGGPGFQVDNCVGGWSSAHYVDLLDDAATGHFGYAVVWGGATRGHAVRGGSATRIRHGVTTAALNGTIAGLTGLRGEPESCVATPAFVVSDSRNAGLDTHEAGQGCMLLASVFNCAIGVQDRATNTIMAGTVQGADRFGFHITASAVNPILINPTVLAMGNQPGAAAFRIAAPATLESPYYPVATAGVPSVNATADYTVRGGGYIAGSTAGNGIRQIGLVGKSAVTPSGTAEIKQALVDLGLLESGEASLTSGLVSVTATGTVQSRLSRAVATNAADVPFRSDGVSGATGDLAQYRVNGSNKVRIGPNGEVEVIDPGAGIILRSSVGIRYRITVSAEGILTATRC